MGTFSMRVWAALVFAVAAQCLAVGQSHAKDLRDAEAGLGGAAVIQLEFKHNVVYAVQKQLTSLGYNPRGVDGRWGPNTRNALNEYRQDNGLTAQSGLDWGVLESLFGTEYVQWKIDDLSPDDPPAVSEQLDPV